VILVAVGDRVSEFSESYHVYGRSRDELSATLERAGIPGLAFPTTNDWTTFVPFGTAKAYVSRVSELGGFATYLSDITNSVVLDYRFAEDHLWGFALCRSGSLIGHYVCAWDPGFSIERDLKDDSLKILRGASRRPDELEEVLVANSHEDVVDRAVPQRFAELLGLGHVAWLSPAYAQVEPEPYLEAGAVRIGRRPTEPEKRVAKPRIGKLVLARPDASAREVFEILASRVHAWDPSFYARAVTLARVPPKKGLSGPLILPTGRLGPAGGWAVTFDSQARESVVHVTAFTDGTVSIIALKGLPRSIVAGKPYLPKPLPGIWKDSTEVAELLKEKWPTLEVLSRVRFALHEWGEHHRQVWSAHFFYNDKADALFLIDSITGEVLK